MKKNGFVFLETIIVLVIVTLSLSMLLVNYSLIARIANTNTNYDLASDKYLMYSISNFGTNSTYNYENLQDGIAKITSDSCNILSTSQSSAVKNSPKYLLHNIFGSGSADNVTSCKNYFKNLELVSIYKVDNVNLALNSKLLKNESGNSVNQTEIFDNGTIEYLKTLTQYSYDKSYASSTGDIVDCSSNSINKDKYCSIKYLIGVFKKNESDYFFASIGMGAGTDSQIAVNLK